MVSKKVQDHLPKKDILTGEIILGEELHSGVLSLVQRVIIEYDDGSNKSGVGKTQGRVERDAKGRDEDRIGLHYALPGFLFPRMNGERVIQETSLDWRAAIHYREVHALHALSGSGHTPDFITYDPSSDMIIMEELGQDQGWVSLEKALDRDCLNPEDHAEIIMGLAKGLRAIHERRIVHKDIKPGNIMIRFGLQEEWEVKYIDFNGCQFTHSFTKKRKRVPYFDSVSLHTDFYAALEQYYDNYYNHDGSFTQDHRVDQFALATTILEMISRENRFWRHLRTEGIEDPKRQEYVNLLSRNILNGTSIFPVRLPAEYSGIESVLLKGSEPDPNKRYRSTAVFLNALEHEARTMLSHE